MHESQLIRRRNRRFLILVILTLAIATLVMMPAKAFGADLVNGGSYAACAQDSAGASADWTNCLPSGRWGKSVGIIMTRTEQATGLFSPVQNLGSQIGTTMRLMMPNMLLSLTQVFWSGALGMSQFAASFTPLNAMGQTVDKSAASLVDGLMQGSLPAVFLVVGIMGGFIALVFKSQQQGQTVLRRTLVSLGCFALLGVMGAQASRSTATTPATGSPWWVVKTVNDTVNNLAVGVDLDGMNDTSQMMSYSGGNGNCQSYLYQMRQQYLGTNGGPSAPSDQSNVVTAVDRLWQETALRSYVTLQWGNPQTGGASNTHVAANAQQAYCHVLEASSGTPVSVQKDLTNAATGLTINDNTAKFLFSKNGWISTADTSVNTSDKAKDSDETTKLDRMGVFWETCTATGGKTTSRDGWNKLVNNLSDKDSGPIWGAGSKNMLRMGLGGKSGDDDGNNDKQWNKIAPDSDTKIMVAGDDYNQQVTQLCSNVFGNKIWNNYDSNGHAKEPSGDDDDKDYSDTNLGDSASMGWRFDVPNVGGTYREANMYNEDPNSANGSVLTSLNYLYGTNAIDTNGAVASVIGSIVNFCVWGLFSFILILCKLMLTLMPLLLVAALFIQAFPIGETIRSSTKRWFKFTINLSMMGIMYGIVASIATFICQILLRATAASSGTFFYQIMAGLSPVFALLIIALFCSKVLHVGNPFSLKAMMEIAGGGALAIGASRIMSQGMRYATMSRMLGRGRRRGHDSQGTRARNGNATESTQIAEKASQEQTNGGEDQITTTSPITQAGDDPNLGAKASARADAAQQDIIATRAGAESDKAWFNERLDAHQAGGENISGFLSDHGVNASLSHGIGSTAAFAANAATAASAPFRRRALQQNIRRVAKSAVKIGAVGAGMTAIAATGGAALALPAGIALAGTVATKGAQKGLAYHRAASAIAAGATHAPSPSTGSESSQVADDAALGQDTMHMGVNPTTTPLPDTTPIPVTSAPFTPPATRTGGSRPAPTAKPLASYPRPAWNADDPEGSKQALAKWHQNERDIEFYNKESANIEGETEGPEGAE